MSAPTIDHMRGTGSRPDENKFAGRWSLLQFAPWGFPKASLSCIPIAPTFLAARIFQVELVLEQILWIVLVLQPEELITLGISRPKLVG